MLRRRWIWKWGTVITYRNRSRSRHQRIALAPAPARSIPLISVVDSVADPDDFWPDPYPDLDPTSRSGSGFGSEFSLNFLLFFIFLLFYSKFRFGSVVYSRFWIRNRRPWFRSLAKSICTVYRYLMLYEMVYSQSESGGSTVTTPTSRYDDSSCYFCSCREYR